jgi:AP-3 complex subunit beta
MFCGELASPSRVKWAAPTALWHPTSYSQDPEVKLQIISLAAKLLVLNPTSTALQLLGQYALTLARYDQDYDVRDRARLVASLLMGVVANVLGDEEYDKGEHGGVVLRREQVKMVLFENKAQVKEPSALEGVFLCT